MQSRADGYAKRLMRSSASWVFSCDRGGAVYEQIVRGIIEEANAIGEPSLPGGRPLR